MHTITLIPGDGIGPEVVDAAVEIIEASGVSITWDRQEAGAVAEVKYGSTMPDAMVNSIIKNQTALKGPISTPIGGGFTSVNVALRKRLNLYANVRPARTVPGVKTRYENVDVVIVRENSEDLYSGLEHIVVPGVVESLKIITETACMRIGQYAFQYAADNGRRKVTSVHKANIMKLADGLFLDCMRRVQRDFPQIDYEEVIVDNACMQLVTRPEQYDVMVMENLYGDIISDLCAGLIGGLGLTASANVGADGIALFEAVHGSAPDIAGKDLANPTAIVLSAAMMLTHLGEHAASKRIRDAIDKVLLEGRVRTGDLGGTSKCSEYTRAVIAAM